ncbi:MAG TPA: hypothetical protein VEZ55_00640, partial [Chitinophagaceae bacterium]|nr:hypothetical protein [Chitinophagaceae bacterium]
MKTRNGLKTAVFILLLMVIISAVYYAWFAFPIISGYNAKNACSCAFVQGRTRNSIMQEELSSFPLSSGGIEINYKDSSASGTVLGF